MSTCTALEYLKNANFMCWACVKLNPERNLVFHILLAKYWNISYTWIEYCMSVWLYACLCTYTLLYCFKCRSCTNKLCLHCVSIHAHHTAHFHLLKKSVPVFFSMKPRQIYNIILDREFGRHLGKVLLRTAACKHKNLHQISPDLM